MNGSDREKWMYLCQQAANEQDPEKLLELAKEINHMLEKRRRFSEMERRLDWLNANYGAN